MKIIISPAKKMLTDNDVIVPKQLPVFIEKTEQLRKYLKSLSYDELKALLACNDDIASLNYERYQHMELNRNLSPAVLSYDGIQYKYMAPQVFEDRYFEYIEKHLRIISGFYGIQYITCIFGEMLDGRIKEKGVYVKMARGEMVRYMAENDIEDLDKIKEFDRLGFKYKDSLSEKNKFVFIKEK